MCATYSKPLCFKHNCRKASNKTCSDFVVLKNSPCNAAMCDNEDDDIPPLASRVEDIEEDDVFDDNFGISVGDRDNDVMCEHSKINEIRGNNKTAVNDMRSSNMFDEKSENNNENIGKSVGDRENDTAHMKRFNLMSTSQKQTEFFEEDESINDLKTSCHVDVQFHGDNVDVDQSDENNDPTDDAFNPEGTDFINSRDVTLHEIGCHHFVEKELQLFCDTRHESLCYNKNGRMIQCNKC